VVQLADGESDREWARRGPNMDPQELARQARKLRKPSAEDSRARHAARELKMWWNRDKTMLSLRGRLPDAMGAQFEKTITHLTEQMKVPGEPWRPFDQRAADALLALCDPPAADDGHTPTLAHWPGCRSRCRCTIRRRSPGSQSPTVCWSSCARTRRSRRCWLTTTVRCWRSDERHRGCHRRSAGRRCCVTRGVGYPVVGDDVDWRCITWCPGVGAVTMRLPTAPRCAPRTTDCWFRTGCSRWSAIPTCPTVSNSSLRVGGCREFRCDAVQVNRLPTTR
jgi:hypothetical protein